MEKQILYLVLFPQGKTASCFSHLVLILPLEEDDHGEIDGNVTVNHRPFPPLAHRMWHRHVLISDPCPLIPLPGTGFLYVSNSLTSRSLLTCCLLSKAYLHHPIQNHRLSVPPPVSLGVALCVFRSLMLSKCPVQINLMNEQRNECETINFSMFSISFHFCLQTNQLFTEFCFSFLFFFFVKPC